MLLLLEDQDLNGLFQPQACTGVLSATPQGQCRVRVLDSVSGRFMRTVTTGGAEHALETLLVDPSFDQKWAKGLAKVT